MTNGRFAAWTLCVALAAAGGATAQTARALLSLSPDVLKASAARLDLSQIGKPAAFTDAQAEALRTGVARTAVDHRFDERLTASLGFLCDPHAAMQYDSAAAMPGADPQGKFLGAKLSLAFR